MKNRAKFDVLLPVLAALACLFAGGCGSNRSDRDIVWIDPNAVYKKLGVNTLIIDTRSKKEYDEGHIPDAKLVKLADIDLQAEKQRFPGYKLIVVYGQNPGSGAASAMAKRLMITKHKNVRAMTGGFEQWTREGLPVEISRPNPNDAPVE